MNRTLVINIVGLSKKLLGSNLPFISSYAEKCRLNLVSPTLPAVTTTMQSCYLTGKEPSEHGIVGNGWYDRTDAEVKFWKQSNRLVGSEKIWEAAKKENPYFTCANLFWWYNMYSKADYSVTPRPQYHADGVKVPDCYSFPASLRDELQQKLGIFPLFHFWGPMADIRSSRWIGEAAKYIEEKYSPTLSLVYLPHLDYALQKFGHDIDEIGKDLAEIDQLVKELVNFFSERGCRIVLLSEYGIRDVSQPVYLNRILRNAGFLDIRVENGLELLDPGASDAFALADHQVAHLYINNSGRLSELKKLLEATPGIEMVLDDSGKKTYRLDHERSGDLVAVAASDSWFAYYYWQDDRLAPDFARIVDIHRKPGYDPVEMFMDPKNRFIKLRAAYKLLRKKLGMRYLMDVIPLDATLIKGSHGSIFVEEDYFPVLISEHSSASASPMKATDVYQVIWKSVFG